MSSLVIRRYEPGDAPALRAVFVSSVHDLARRDYTPAQLGAWAPREHDAEAWARRLGAIRPFVALVDGVPAGFADVQPDGLLDLFYVAGPHAGRGVGTALMEHLHAEARSGGIGRLWSYVSRTAEPFFARRGFVVESRRVVTVRGVELDHARMGKVL
jgi:putative acetyltransferase